MKVFSYHVLVTLCTAVQVENEYASLVRGDHGAEPTEHTFPILRTVECNNQEVKGTASEL